MVRAQRVREKLTTFNLGIYDSTSAKEKVVQQRERATVRYIGRPVPTADKCYWYLNGLGPQFVAFSDTRMSMLPMPSFVDLVHQAQNYEQLSRFMDRAPSAMPTFAMDQRSASSQRRSSSHLGVSVLIKFVFHLGISV
ncbi:hypothetical protein ACS0TY_018028 [Phlomoides rotata]